MENFNIETITVGAFEENSYIVTIDNDLYLVDPGAESNRLIDSIEESEKQLKAVLLTHAHIDHISALPEILQKYNVNVFLHKDDVPILNSPVNAFEPFYSSVHKHNIKTTDDFKALPFDVITTPGHTKGGICFYFKDQNVLICGDTLFYGSIGRTDLPGGNFTQIQDSIKNKLFKLPEVTKVYSGHGPTTTIGYEKKHNMFI